MDNALYLPDRVEFKYINGDVVVEEEIRVVCPLCGRLTTKVFTLKDSTVYIHRFTYTLVECRVRVEEERRVIPDYLSKSEVAISIW